MKKYSELEMKEDGYIDVAKKIGNQKSNGNNQFIFNLADESKIASLYVGNGLAKRYIDIVVSDMTREWIDIPEDTDGTILKYQKKIQAKKQIKNALRSSKLFGGSLIFMVIDDGNLPNEPVNTNNIRSVKKLKFFSRKNISIEPENYYSDPIQENFGEPQYFNINTNNKTIVVHESRCLIFQGEYCPSEEFGSRTIEGDKYWGLGILQSIHENLEDYGLSLQALCRSLLKCNVDVLKIKNLFMLLKNKDGQKQLDARLQSFDLSKSVSTTLLLDNEENYESISQSMSGLADVFSKIESNIAAMAGVPGNILFGIPVK
jgi:phage-related protein (TIGR01555 family)